MKNIILIAAPSAGKGTEAKILNEEFSIPHISTGDLLRDATKKNDDTAKMINELISNGKFVSDEIVLNLLKDRLSMDDCLNGYILDGFPRNVEQAKAYDKILMELNKDIGLVIVMDIDKEIAKSRVVGRYICPKCGKIYNINNELKPKNGMLCDDCNIDLIHRSDDTAETYEERYKTYVEKTQPLIEYYSDKGVLYHVNAGINMEETHNQIKKIIGDQND